MNNRNPHSSIREELILTSPGANPTHFNVFTVEEYENNGKSGKR